MNEDCFHLGIKAVIVRGKKILLLKVNTENMRNYTGDAYWDIPGGRIQKGSSVEETLKREVEEETGITSIVSFTPIGMVLANIRIPVEGGDVGLILAAYQCEVDGKIQVMLSDEHVAYEWFTAEEASELLKVKYPREFTDSLKALFI